jgi:hypothetical protein
MVGIASRASSMFRLYAVHETCRLLANISRRLLFAMEQPIGIPEEHGTRISWILQHKVGESFP